MTSCFSLFRLSVTAVAWGLAGLCILLPRASRAWSEPQLDFAHDVVPILRKHCIGCHAGEKAEGGFSMNTRRQLLDSQVAVPGSAARSPLVERIESRDPEQQMPPADRARLSAREVELLRTWIEQGLEWQEGFQFGPQTYEPPLKPRRPALPAVGYGSAHPIDRILDAYLADHQHAPLERVRDEEFLRRVSLDLIGRLPTPAQRSAFLADQREDKRLVQIRALLEDREQYTEHWLTFWNDLLRNAYSGTGYIDGGRQPITGWLYAALYENKPYDQFVRELISPANEGSGGFIRGIQWRGNVNASQTREIQFAQNTAQVFLGINLKCASCHDSFIDRWTLAETYGLAAIYASEPLEIHRCDKPLGRSPRPAWIFPELGEVDPESPQPARLRQLAHLMTHPQNGRLTRTIANRIWQRLMGRGIIHPVDAMHTRPWSDDLLDYLAVYLADHEYDLKKLMEHITDSHAYQSQAVVLAEVPGADYAFTGPLAKRLTAEQFFDAIWSITDTWPTPIARDFARDGRGQWGQLTDVLQVLRNPQVVQDMSPAQREQSWGTRPYRAALGPLLPLQGVLGRPSREQVVTTRPAQLTTLEAIELANGPELAELLSQGSRQLQAKNMNSHALVTWLYEYALSRSPQDDERELAIQLLDGGEAQQGLEDLLWSLFMLPEFQWNR